MTVENKRIKSVTQGTNAHLIATAQKLYPMNGAVLDLTPGEKLGFWKEFRPEILHLLGRDTDFRSTPFPPEVFDHVVFDPPYVAKGGHSTSTIPEMNKRYGMLHVERNPLMQWQYQILPGIREAHRLLVKDGLLWFKLQDYVTSGKVWWFTKESYRDLAVIGFDLEDEFILDGNPGPQPLTTKCNACQGSGRVYQHMAISFECPVCEGVGTLPRIQKHAAKAHSVLQIARKR